MYKSIQYWFIILLVSLGNKDREINETEMIKQTTINKIKDTKWQDLIHVKSTSLELIARLIITNLAISFKL